MKVPEADQLVDAIIDETGWSPYEVFDLPLWRARKIAKLARRRQLTRLTVAMTALLDRAPRPAGACWPPAGEPT